MITDAVLFPAEDVLMLRSFADAMNRPSSHSVDCVALPALPLAPLAEGQACNPKLVGPSLLDFYPEPEKREGIEGVVMLEMATNPIGPPQDVRVVESSGNANLDSAAIWYASFLRTKEDCQGKRTRARVHFKDQD